MEINRVGCRIGDRLKSNHHHTYLLLSYIITGWVYTLYIKYKGCVCPHFRTFLIES